MKTIWWQPQEIQRKLFYLDQRDQLIRALRAFFHGQGFREVETPALQISPGLEPHLMAFNTIFESPIGRTKQQFYLHTSPEFAMKKLLVGGLPKIFQLAKVYRNREWSHTHHPEFTMLEWYRAGAPYTEIMEDTIQLLRRCSLALGVEKVFTWKGVKSDPHGEWERLTVQEAFLRYTKIDILGTIDDPKNPNPADLREAAKARGHHLAEDDTWEDIFFRLFLTEIEPQLGVGVPTILYDYPISMAALAQPKPSDPTLAERFEVYVCGLELANAFGELNDAKAQAARFTADMDKKEKLYGYRYPIDGDFLAALEYGLPASSGIALGIDRLVMLATGADQITDVLWAPVSDPALS
jgi:lysyl-tRNA synthetase class 2